MLGMLEKCRRPVQSLCAKLQYHCNLFEPNFILPGRLFKMKAKRQKIRANGKKPKRKWKKANTENSSE
jgi:hypothetical protein